MQINLLTGAVIEVRKWRLSDMDTLLKASGSGFLSSLLKVFNDCTIAVIDPGIYSSFEWKKAYEGDLYDALWQWRGISLGNEYAFSVVCPSCKRKLDLTCDVSEVVRKYPTDDVLSSLREGKNRIDVSFSGGSFKLLIPTAEEVQAISNTADRKASSIRHKGAINEEIQDVSLIQALRQKVLSVTVDGTVLEGGKLASWLSDIDLDVGSEILSLIEEYSFGIDTAVDLTCGNCGHVFAGDIPMQKSFFLQKGGRL